MYGEIKIIGFAFEETSFEQIRSDMKEKGGENNLTSKRRLFHKLC